MISLGELSKMKLFEILEKIIRTCNLDMCWFESPISLITLNGNCNIEIRHNRCDYQISFPKSSIDDMRNASTFLKNSPGKWMVIFLKNGGVCTPEFSQEIVTDTKLFSLVRKAVLSIK
jgi:hypothetical protein